MTTKLTLKKVLNTDVKVLQAIAQQTFMETYTPHNTMDNMRKYLDEKLNTKQLEQELNNLNSAFYFASLENDIVGYLKVNFKQAQTNFKDGDAMEIERIYVLQAFQGNQIGKYLCAKAIAFARQANIRYVWLGVWEQNPKAISFYKKNGFIPVDKHIFKLGDDCQTDIIMQLKCA